MGMGSVVFGLISMSRGRFQFAMRLCGVVALAAATLSFGLIFSSRPISAVVPKQTFRGPAAVEDPLIQQAPPPPSDSGLREEMFRTSLLMDVSSDAKACQLDTCAMGAPPLPKVDLKKQTAVSTSSRVVSAIPGAVKVGSLICNSVQTSPELNCLLKLTNKKSTSRYVAAVRQTSHSDLEVSQKITITWGVFSSSKIFAERQFAGGYAEDQSQPAAQRRRAVLVGGEHDEIKLLPQTNQAVAATVANMQLAAQ